MAEFLDTLDFLTPDQRAILAAEDLTSPAAFKHITIEALKALGFKLGRASLILDAAGVPAAGAAVPTNITVHQADPPDLEARIDRALVAARKDPTKAPMLHELGVPYAVLEADDKLDEAKTRDLRRHLAAGAPLPDSWHGQRIAATRTLSTPPLWCVPRTGVPLQNGRDGATDIPWGELLLDGLRLTAFGLESGFFGGLADETIFARMKENTGGVREKLAERAKNAGVNLATMDRRVVFTPARVPDSDGEPAPFVIPRHANPTGNLAELLASLFENDQLHRFLGSYTDGAEVREGVMSPNSSRASYTFAVADALRAGGYIDSDLCSRLTRARPRRARDIAAVFETFGIR